MRACLEREADTGEDTKMVAIVAGQGLGLSSTSQQLLGGGGVLGSAQQGRSGERVVVNAATGNLVVQQQDEWLVGVGPDAGVLRTYNSLGTGTDDNGDNWRLGLSRRIQGLTGTVNTAGSTVRRVGEDGQEALYSWDGSRYVNKNGAGSFDTLTYTAGVWTWADGDTQVKETYTVVSGFDARLTRVVDPNGNKLELSYAGGASSYLVTEIATWSASTASGEKVVITYSSVAGQTSDILSLTTTYLKAGVVQPALKRVSYTYETYNTSQRRLKTVTVDLTPQDSTDNATAGTTYVTTYTYVDATSRRLSGIDQSDGSKLAFTYTGDGKIYTVRETVGGQLRTLVFTYNTATGATRILDTLGQTTELVYELAAGQNQSQLKEIRMPAVGGVAQTQVFSYDAHGNVQTVNDARGNVTQYQYDGNGNRVYERDAQNNVVRRTYSATNQLLTETLYRDLDPDGAGAGAPQKGLSTRYVYETTAGKTHQLRFVLSPTGQVTENIYNTAGQVGSVIRYAGGTYDVGSLGVDALPTLAQMVTWTGQQAKSGWQRTDNTYDSRGNLDLSTAYASVDANGLGVSAGSSSTQYVYDQAGNLLQKIDGRPFVTDYTYDGLNRVTSAKDPVSGLLTVTSYKDASLQTVVTSANGLVTTLTYDAAGRVVSMARSASSEGALGTTTYTYDSLNRLSSVTQPTGEKSYFVYDAAGRKVGEIDGEGALTEYQYNGNNQVVRTLRWSNRVSAAMVQVLAAGTAGLPPNLLSNAVGGWSLTKVPADAGLNTSWTTGTGSDGMLTGEPTRWLEQPANSAASTGTLSSPLVSVVPGKRYEVSTYVGVTNATANMVVEYYDSTGKLVTTSAVLGTANKTGGATLADHSLLRSFVMVPASPAGIVSMKVVVTKATATNTTLASRLHLTHPVVTEATATQTQYSMVDLRPQPSTLDRSQWNIYDKAGRLIKTVTATNESVVSALRGAVEEFRYDGAGRLTDTIRYATLLSRMQMSQISARGAELQAADGQITAKGQVMTLTVDAANDRRTRHFYNADGRLIGKLDAEDNYTEYTYDGAGQLVRSSAYANRMMGTLADPSVPPQVIAEGTSLTTGAYVIRSGSNYSFLGADQHTYYVYNGLGQVSTVIDAELYATAYTYDESGNKTKETRYANRTTTAATGTIALGSILTTTGTWTARYVAANANDRSTTYSYDGNNRLTRQELQPTGLITEYTYDPKSGDLVKVVTALGAGEEERTTQRRYDKLGRLTQELTAEGVKALAALVSPTQAQIDGIWSQYGTRHEYDSSGRRIATITPNGVDGAGLKTVYYYDQAGRLVYSINALGEVSSYDYNAFGNLSQQRRHALRLGSLTGYSGGLKSALSTAAIAALEATKDATLDEAQYFNYNQAGLLVGVTDAFFDRTTHTYNAFGERLSTYQNRPDFDMRETAQVYDRLGRVNHVTVKDAFEIEQRTTSRYYDAFGRVIQSVDANGSVREYYHDKLGRAIIVTEPNGWELGTQTTYDAFGRTTSVMEPNSQRTTFAYNDAARTMTTTVPLVAAGRTPGAAAESVTLVTRFNRHGQQVELVDGRGHITRFSYNKDGQLTASSLTDAGGTLIKSTATEYDKAARVWRTTGERGGVTRVVYDAANRVLTRVQDDNGLKLTSEYRYDARGNAVWAKDASGVWTQTEYNAKGQVEAITVDPAMVPDAAAGSGSSASNTFALIANAAGAAALKQRTIFGYSVDGTLFRTVHGDGTAEAETTEYWYDVLGRRVAEIRDPDGLALKTSYTYDKNDNVVARKDALGQTTRYVYNAINRVSLQVDATGAVTRYDYNENGLVSRTVAYSQRISLTGLGDQVTKEQIEALLPAQPGASDQVTHNFYDLDDRLSMSVDALGYATRRVYDKSGNVAQVVRYANKVQQQDLVGLVQDDRLTFREPGVYTSAQLSATPPMADTPYIVADATRDQAQQYVYDAAGRLTWQVDAAGYVTQTQYDTTGRWKVTTRYANKVVYPAGQDKLVVNTAPLVLSSAPSPVTQAYVLQNIGADRVEYAYFDALGRQTAATDALNYTTSWTYDANGRVKQSLRFAKAGQQDLSDVNNAKTSYDYDSAGRLIRTTDAEGAVTFNKIDAAGRIVETTLAHGTADASTTQYTYDAAGRVTQEARVLSASEKVTTRYVLNAVGQRVQVIDARGVEAAEGSSDWAKAERKRLIGVEAAPAVGSAEHATLLKAYTTVQVFDAQGRITQSTDALGGSTLTEYDAFGNAVKVTDPNGNSGFFFFDKANNQVFQIDPNGGAVKTERDGFGNAVRITRFYDGVGGEIQVGVEPVVYDAEPATEPTHAYIVRSSGYLTPYGTLYGGDATTTIEHDALNRQVAIKDALGFTERMVYGDAFGNKTAVVNKLGAETTFAYDKLDRMTSSVQAEKVKRIDSEGKVLLDAALQPMLDSAETRYEYDGRGNQTKKIEAYGTSLQKATVYAYDKRNRLISTTGEAMTAYTVERGTVTQAPVETRKYDLRGNLVEITDASGLRTLSWFDALDRKVAELKATTVQSDGQVVGSLVTFEYNSGDMVRQRAWGQSVSVPATRGTTAPAATAGSEVRDTWFTYDANHRLTRTTIKDVVVGEINGASGNFNLDPRDLVTAVEYDANGNAIVETDARGGKTFNYYDSIGNRIASVDPARFVTFWLYDSAGNVVLQVRTARQLPSFYEIAPDSDALTLVNMTSSMLDRGTVQYRDVMGRVLISASLDTAVFNPFATKEEELYLKAAPGSYPVTQYTYNVLGQVTKKVETNGETSEWVYDKQGREISQLGAVFADFENESVRSVTDTEYNALGEVQRSIRRGKVATSEVDDRVTVYAYGTNGLVSKVIAPTGAVTLYEYDLAGHLTRTRTARLDGTDGFNRIANKDVGRLYLERNGSVGQPNVSTYRKVYSASGFSAGKTAFTADFSLGSNAVDRSFDIAFAATENGSKLVSGTTVNYSIPVLHGIQIRGGAVNAVATTAAGTATGTAVTLKNDANYQVLVQISVDGSGNFVSTLRVFDQAAPDIAVLTDTRTLGKFAWTQLAGQVINRATPSSTTSAGLGAVDSVDRMVLTVPDVAPGLVTSNIVDPLDALALDANVTVNSGARNMMIYDASGATSRSTWDVQEFAYDAAGREVRRHSYNSATGAHARSEGASNGTLVIDRKAGGGTGWADLNGSQSVAWGNGTAFYSEVRVGTDGTGRNFTVGIQSGDTGPGVTVPSNLGRHAVNFVGNQFTFSYANNGAFATAANHATLEAGAVYVVEVRVEKNQLGETWSRLYVYKKGTSIASAWQDARKVGTLWSKAQVLVGNYSTTSGSSTVDTVDFFKLTDATNKSVSEDFSFRSKALGSLTPDQSTTAKSMWIQDAIGAAESTNSTTSELRYNAYGEVVEKGQNGGSQEWAQFDKAGRAVRTMGADGVPRIYVYDANGNITLTLSPPADGNPSDAVRTIFLGNAAITSGDIKTLLSESSRVLISAHDQRNQLTDTFEASSSKLFASTNQLSSTMGSVVAEEVKNYPAAATVATGKGVSVNFTYDSKFYSTWTGGGSGNDRSLATVTDTFKLNLSRSGVVGQKYTVELQVYDGHSPRHGRGYVEGTRQVFEITEGTGTGMLEAGGTFSRYPRGNYWADYGDVSGAGMTVRVYKVSDTGQKELIATMGGELPRTGLPPYRAPKANPKPASGVKSKFGGLAGGIRLYFLNTEARYDLTISASGGVETPTQKSFTVSSLPEGTKRAVIQYRITDQTPATWHTASVNVVNGKVVFGEDVLRAIGSTTIDTSEKGMSYVLSTLDDAGRVLSVQSGEVGVYRDATAANYYYGMVIQPPATQEDRTGRIFSTAEGVNFVSATVSSDDTVTPVAKSVLVRFRAVGESAWSTAQVVNAAVVGGVSTPGWFRFTPPGVFTAGKTFEYTLELKHGADDQGETLDTLNGYMTASSGTVSGGAYAVYDGAPPIKADRSPSILRLQDVPVDAASVSLTYTLTKRVWTDTSGAPLAQGGLVVERQGTVVLTKGADGKYQWDAAVVALDPTLQYTLDYTVTVKNSSNAVLGTMTSREALRRGATSPTFDAVIYSPSAASTDLFRVSSSLVKLTHSTAVAQQVRKVVLSYRPAGSTGAYKDLVATLTPDDQGLVNQVEFDLSKVAEWNSAAAFTDFEVYYRYEDGNGKVILGYTVNRGEDFGAPTQFTPVIVRALPAADFNSGSSDAATALWGFANAPTTSHRQQVYNAFGEVAYELTANNMERARKKKVELGRLLSMQEFTPYASWMYYDGQGRVVVKVDPESSTTFDNGYQARGRATTVYMYDHAGRLVGTRDARGYETAYAILPTGDGRRLVTQEVRPGDTAYYLDNFSGYDVFGDLRYKFKARTETEYVGTTYYYDKLGRLTRVDMPPGDAGRRATHLYSYDSKGNRVQHRTSPTDTIDANSGLGVKQITEFTLFDVLGRVRKTISGEGLVTTTEYGVAANGQSTKVYTDENGKKLSDWMDQSGRVLRHVDMSGGTFRYDYNLAGNLTGQFRVDANNVKMAGEQDITYSYWADGTLRQISDNTLKAVSLYEYDKDGNRVYEAYTVNNINLQTSTISYDEVGRIIQVTDKDYFKLNYEYDQVGNRRRVYSQKVDAAGSVDYWYTYDGQNRMLISMGQLTDGRATSLAAPSRITQGTTGRGVKLTYDRAGNRASALYAGQTDAEIYTYTADGYLTRVTKGGAQISLRTNDLLGRVTTYVQNNADGVVTETRQYDNDNRLTSSKTTNTKAGSAVIETWNYYQVVGGTTKTGLLMSSKTVTGATISQYRYDYIYRDAAMQSGIKVDSSDPSVSPTWGRWASGVSQFNYNVNGHLASVKDSRDATNTDVRTINFTVNANGQVLKREETGSFSVMPFQRYFYVDGRRVVEWANKEIPNSVSYAEALMAPPSDDANPRDRYRNLGPIRADVDQNYTPISASYPAFTPGGYTVRSGDTMEAIARAVWGDATMWYLIAEANGLMSNADLRVGQVLVIPNKVTNFHNNSQTVRVYNPGEIMGDVSPTSPEAPVAPPPPDPEGCGGLGMVLMIVVAVVATIATAGAAAMAMGAVGSSMMSVGMATLAGTATVAGGAALGFAATVGAAMIGGAVGSIASQLTGMATGDVQKFSWSQVAMGAIGAGVGVGAGAVLGPVSAGNNAYVEAGLTAARNNVISQGVSMAAGLQKKFDWRGVAAAAAGGAIGEALRVDLPPGQTQPQMSWGTFGRQVATGVLTGAARAAIYDRKPDWSAIALESFGSALGDAVVGSIAQADARKAAQKQEPDYQSKPLTQADIDSFLSGLDDIPGAGAAPGAARDARGMTFSENAKQRAELIAQGMDPDAPVADAPVPQGIRGKYVKVKAGDTVSGLMGSSSPQAVGAFLAGNDMTTSDLRVGQMVFVPDDVDAFGSQSELGRSTLDSDNRRLASAARSVTSSSDQQAEWDRMRTGAWSGRTGDGVPTYHTSQTRPTSGLSAAADNRASQVAAVALAGEFAGLDYSLDPEVASGYAGPAGQVGTPVAKYLTSDQEVKVGFALYAGIGGNAEMTLKTNLTKLGDTRITEFEAALGLGVGFKGLVGVKPLDDKGATGSLGVYGGKKLGGQADRTAAISTKAGIEYNLPLVTVVPVEGKVGFQSSLNGAAKVPARYGELKLGEVKLSPSLQVGGSAKWDIFNTSYKYDPRK